VGLLDEKDVLEMCSFLEQMLRLTLAVASLLVHLIKGVVHPQGEICELFTVGVGRHFGIIKKWRS
jgi:hypothetical protein